MLEGITILSTVTINGNAGLIGLGLFAIVIGIMFIAGGIVNMDESVAKGILMFLVSAACIVGGVFSFINCYRAVAQYKVTISDGVKMQDFTKRYRIIDQDGRIFTIEEKEMSDSK